MFSTGGSQWHIVSWSTRICHASFQRKIYLISYIHWDGASLVAQQQRICLQVRSHRKCSFDPWVGKIPWRRTQQPTPSTLAWRILLCPSRKISQWPPGSRYPMQKQESFYYQARAGAPTRYWHSGYREEPRVLGYIAYIGYSHARNLKIGSFWVGRHLIGYLLWKG